ncbi:MAG: T9SS type A sorting domain-containing protein [Flammeovirgaceae bacterium]
MLRPFNTSFLCLFFLLLSNAQVIFAQVELVPIWRTPPPEVSFKKNLPYARTSDATVPMLLPFWDDFSLNKFDPLNNTAYPNDTLWEYSRRVWVNDQMGINPPSIFVATFDGYDSLGKPYSKNDILAKGFADRLTSRPLRMDLVAPANRNNVFLKFFYQYQGNGEAPDAGDILYLYLKDKNGIWNEVWKIENDGTLDKTKFVEVPIQITDPKYFHNKFQFRFQNFGRTSGPYDTWNVDYVYVSNGKKQYSPVYPDFPDRTIVSGPNSFLVEYQSIPIKHFRLSPNSYIRAPEVLLTNLRNDPAKQPINYSVRAKVTVRKNGALTSTTNLVSNNVNIGSPLAFGEFKLRSIPGITSLPSLTTIDNQIDSIAIKVMFNLDSSDHVIKPIKNGDWDTTVYTRIDFRHNDTTRTTYYLGSYYAYDDGTAEYGARINGIGSQLAYEFNMKTNAVDTLVAIDYYFPPFGDESSQSVQFHILGALTGQETDYLYRRNTVIKRSANNLFVREALASPVTVQGKFYIGWRLLSNALIPVGLDRSFDSGSKMFYNISGDWEQNTTLKGSLMVRPVFIRQGQTPPTVGVEGEPVNLLYPNPNNGVFYLPAQSEQISVIDMTGRHIVSTIEDQLDQKKISVEANTGIYVVRYFDGKWKSVKMAITP